jgi:MinD-like ATPase involved in chromosome partitioning or flagellar assembly
LERNKRSESLWSSRPWIFSFTNAPRFFNWYSLTFLQIINRIIDLKQHIKKNKKEPFFAKEIIRATAYSLTFDSQSLFRQPIKLSHTLQKTKIKAQSLAHTLLTWINETF